MGLGLRVYCQYFGFDSWFRVWGLLPVLRIQFLVQGLGFITIS